MEFFHLSKIYSDEEWIYARKAFSVPQTRACSREETNLRQCRT